MYYGKHRMGFPDGSVVKTLPANAGDLGSVPGLGISPKKGNSNPLQYSCLGNLVDRRASYSAWGHEKVGHDLVTTTMFMFTFRALFTTANTWKQTVSINR